MSASISDLSSFRFLKRLADTRKNAINLTEAIKTADDKLKEINERFAKNVQMQRIVNQHLSRIYK